MMKTPLYEWHAQRGAKIVDFAGWQMPLYYSSILEEHKAVRTVAGLFDVCHMGRVRIKGPQSFELLQMTFTNEIHELAVGKARYGLFCNNLAGVIDDAILYKLEDGYLLVPNASNRDTVLQHLQSVAAERHWQVEIEDVSSHWGMFAFQGPKSVEILQSLTSDPVSEMPRFSIRDARVADTDCLVARTGYTGEDGFEIMALANEIPNVWDALVRAGKDAGVQPAGLGARDSLRIEACLPLYGHEITSETNPLFSGLRPYIKLSKPDFIGKNAMLHWTLDDSTRLLVAFMMLERAVPRQHCQIVVNGDLVGEVTSGLFSPTLGRGIGMAYVETSYARPGTKLAVRIHNKSFTAEVAQRPLYKAI